MKYKFKVEMIVTVDGDEPELAENMLYADIEEMTSEVSVTDMEYLGTETEYLESE